MNTGNKAPIVLIRILLGAILCCLCGFAVYLTLYMIPIWQIIWGSLGLEHSEAFPGVNSLRIWLLVLSSMLLAVALFVPVFLVMSYCWFLPEGKRYNTLLAKAGVSLLILGALALILLIIRVIFFPVALEVPMIILSAVEVGGGAALWACVKRRTRGGKYNSTLNQSSKKSTARRVLLAIVFVTLALFFGFICLWYVPVIAAELNFHALGDALENEEAWGIYNRFLIGEMTAGTLLAFSILALRTATLANRGLPWQSLLSSAMLCLAIGGVCQIVSVAMLSDFADLLWNTPIVALSIGETLIGLGGFFVWIMRERL